MSPSRTRPVSESELDIFSQNVRTGLPFLNREQETQQRLSDE